MFTCTVMRLVARSLSPGSWSATVRIAAHCQVLTLRAFVPGPSADPAPAPLMHPFESLHVMKRFRNCELMPCFLMQAWCHDSF